MQKQAMLKLAALCGVPLIMVMGNSMLIPVFTQMQRTLNISQLEAGLTITMFSLPAGISIPILGFLSDRVGRKKIIVPSLLLYGMGGAISGVAAALLAHPYYVLLAGRVLQGIGAGGTAPIAMALVSDIFTSQERSKALGTIEAANGLGKVASPILGAALGMIIWYALFFVYAVLALPIAVAVWFLIQEPSRKDHPRSFKSYFTSIKKIFSRKGLPLVACYLSGSIVLLVLFGVLSYLSDLLEAHYGLKGVFKGFALAGPVLAMSATSYMSGKYLQSRNQKMKVFIVAGLAIISTAMVGTGLSQGDYLFFSSLVAAGIGTGMVLPAVNTLVTSSAPLEERGGITALYGSARFFGVAAGPPAFSLMLQVSKQFMLLTSGAVTAIIALLAYFLIKERLLMEKGREKGNLS